MRYKERMAEKKGRKYSAGGWSPIESGSDEDLERWATDPNCIEMELCAKLLAERIAKRGGEEAELQSRKAAKRDELQEHPFDPRTEVSADARHVASRIVTHLWILLFVIPLVAGLIAALIYAAGR